MKLLTLEQYAFYLGKTKRTIYNWLKAGKIKHRIIVIGKHTFIDIWN